MSVVALAIAEIYSTNAEEQLGPPQTFKMENVSTIAKSRQCYASAIPIQFPTMVCLRSAI